MKKLKFAKKKIEKLSTLKKKAWDIYSKYIRARDCLKTTGTLEKGRCITCGRIFSFKELQAGHFIEGRHSELLFEPLNCNAQCYQCNVLKHGAQRIYTRVMLAMWGEEAVDKLEQRDKIVKNFTKTDLKAIYEAYNDLYKEIIEL